MVKNSWQILKGVLMFVGFITIAWVVFNIIVTPMRAVRVSPVESFPTIGLTTPKFLTERGGGGTDQTSQPVASEAQSRLVIKTGSINMVVKDIRSSVKAITQYAESKGGWVVSSNVSEWQEVPSGSIAVRVPSKVFDETMAYFRGLAEKVTFEGTQGQDVTEQYTDLQSQLRNFEAAEAQLLKIMERSGTIPDVLSVQRELTSIRNQIEYIKGRIQYLEKSVEMALISMNLALSEELLPIPPSEKWRPVYILKVALRSLLANLRSISYLVIWLAVYAIIWVPLAVIIWWKFWRRKTS